MDRIQRLFDQLRENIRPADMLDVLVVAVLLYVVLGWLKKRASRGVAVAVVFFGSLYLCAYFFGMYLSLFFLQTGLTVLVIALVIVFQRDIRHTIEQLISWRPFGNRPRDYRDEIINNIVEAAGNLAESYTGALIVVKGREPVDHLVRGGVSINGKLSQTLLLNIFHHGSPGHDGAVLIDHDRLERFAVHLPLSRNLGKVGPGGTRHTAALGMAENSDSFVIVVSEERGTISVAHNGQIYQTDSVSEVRAGLGDYYDEKFPKREDVKWRRFWTDNLGLKFLSIILSCSLWFAIAFRPETIQRTFAEVPIEYRNLDSQLVIESVTPPNVKVTLAGSERAFAVLKDKQLKFSVNLKDVLQGERDVVLNSDQLDLPPGLTVSRLEPKSIKLSLFERGEFTLPIKVKWMWGPPDAAKYQVKIVPATVKVEMRVSQVKTVKFIETADVPFIGKQETFRTKLKLPQFVTLANDQPEQIRVMVAQKSK